MNKKVPLSPNDIKENLFDVFPEFVIEAVNNLILKNYKGGNSSFSFKKEAIVKEILKLSPESYDGQEITRNVVFDNKWLDFEPLFRKNGWKVEYHSPDRDENFEEYFRFEPAKN